jgi:hypothetical protein
MYFNINPINMRNTQEAMQCKRNKIALQTIQVCFICQDTVLTAPQNQMSEN